MRDVDYTATVAFLRKFFALTGGRVELRVFSNNNKPGPRIFLEGEDAARRAKAFCESNDRDGWAVCFGCATRLDNGSKQGERKDLSEVGAVWIDIDCDKHGLDAEEVASILDGNGLPAIDLCLLGAWGACLLASGREAHVELAPAQKMTGKGGFRRLPADAWRRPSCGDQRCCVITQIMRLPGTHNSKGANRYSRLSGLRMIGVTALPSLTRH